MNTARLALLLAALTGLFLAVGYGIAGPGGMIIALLLAVGMNAFTYWNADRLVLSMQGARPVSRAEAPDFHRIVEQLAANAGLPTPRVFIIDSDQPNAFATGRDPQHAAVAATRGLLANLTEQEVAGVMAHELAHVRGRDTLIMTIVATLAGAISMIANLFFFLAPLGLAGGDDEEGGGPLGIVGILLTTILAPIAAALVQMAISRSNEYRADKGGAEICGHPLWLASALEKLEALAKGHHNPRAEHNPASAHLFIVNPLSGRQMDSLFSTHPSIENRVQRLREMAGQGGGGRGPWG